jgi:hypothetical protein
MRDNPENEIKRTKIKSNSITSFYYFVHTLKKGKLNMQSQNVLGQPTHHELVD